MTRTELIAALEAAEGPITDLDKFYRYAPWYDTAQMGDPIWEYWGKALQGSIDAAVEYDRVAGSTYTVILTEKLATEKGLT